VNWQGDSAPAALDGLTFAGTVRLTPYNNFAGNTSFGLITFNAGGFTVSGNSITLTGGMTNAVGNNTFNPAIVMNSTQTFDVYAGTMMTLGGALSGNGDLTKTNSGTLELAAQNTYAGVTTISGGTLLTGPTGSINNSSGVTVTGSASVLKQTGSDVLKDTGQVTLQNGATWDMTDMSETVAGFSNSHFNSKILLGSGSLTVNNDSWTGVSSQVSGAGGTFTKGGTGLLALSGTMTHTGGTTINGGKISLNNTDNMLPDTGTVTINNTGTLDLSYFSDTIGSLVINSGGKLMSSCGDSRNLYVRTDSLSGNGAIESLNAILNINTGYDNTDTVFGGTMSGNIYLNKYGTGTLTLVGTGTSSAVGTRNIYEGKLQVDGSISSWINVKNGGTLGGAGIVSLVAVESGGTVSPGNSPGTLTTGYEYWYGGGHYLWEMNDAAGTKGVSPGWDWLYSTSSINIQATNTNKFIIDITSLSGDTAGSAANFCNNNDYSWIIASGATSILNFAADKFTLNYSNFTNPLGGGTFGIELVGKDLILKFTHGSKTWNGLGSDSCLSTAGNWVENSAPGNNVGIVFNVSSHRNPYNDLSDHTADSIVFEADGFTLAGNAMTVNNGIENKTGTNAVNTNITLGFDQQFTADAETMLSFGGTVDLGGNALAVKADGTVAMSNVICGEGSLAKNGSGILTLSGSNTFTGATAVNAGTLIVDGYIATSSGVTVADGALLKGAGSVGSVTIDLGGTLAGTLSGNVLSGAGLIAPGNSSGITEWTQIDPTGGLDWDFEFNDFYPDWGNPTDSVNDLVRITGATPFVDPGMTEENIINIYFDVGSIAVDDIFQGGFFTDADSDFLSLISSATFNYYIGSKLIGTNGYFELTTQQVTVDFLNEPGVSGYVAQFKALHEDTADVPEPSTLLLLLPFIGFGLKKMRAKKA
jgi:autotransporter-associated beta strand protein